ncbi:response regulator transcription factor [Paucibacter sp. DJ2R-2]|uniref:response regulator transcription factor n=1 Tax=Paucibacter sp. DJ2R-2 TaxID=2893558 RepID=UPI0021E36BAE|nr:response regulator transcription factor [Paucibacter sp. DJ2R-2]MCV2423513.1 response regulator transcription factor [Paucibacter sp. DJ4R-1]MCV2440565.1 response regulator transcription factor [Paucibacter sp. DJ2R-2]
MRVRVIIADDHHLVREGLVALLEREVDIEVVAQARDGMELVRLARTHNPDVVILDVAMPRMNGIEAIRRIRAEPLSCKLICLSVHAETQQVAAALEAGANGYVLKENSFDELARGVRRVMANQLFLSGELVGEMLQHRSASEAEPESAGHGHSISARLTPREREMVQLFSEGYSAQEIASQLHLSAKTVATHREHVFAKLQIQGIAELTRFALREGLSTLETTRPRV